MAHDRDTDRTLTCRCGTMRWRIAPTARGAHLVCHCDDCQTAAQVLHAAEMLDDAGGTAIFQTLPAEVTILDGAENLALLRLSPKGLLRWHAGCCGTPIANTLASPGFAFVGMVLPPGSSAFGPVRARVMTRTARKEVKAHGVVATGLALFARAIGARLSGRWRETPFFDAAGQPVAPARVLTPAERAAARPA